MKKYFRFFALFPVSLLFAYCAKGPGPGGKASIYGKIKVKNYDNTFTSLLATYYGGGETVYIIYGNHITVDDNVKTSYDGTYEFPYLRTGDYTVLVYSADSTKYLNGVPNPNGAPVPKKTVVVKTSVKISGKRDNVDAGEMTILR